MQSTSRFGRLRQWLRGRALLVDALFAATMWAMCATILAVSNTTALAGFEGQHFGWPQAAMLAAGMSPIALRRRALWPAVVLCNAAILAWVGFDQVWFVADSGITWFTLIYSAGAHRTPLRAAAVGITLWGPASVAIFFNIQSDASGGFTVAALNASVNLLLACTAFFIGWVMRNRRLKVQELSDRARVAEETQRALAAQAVSEEQQRIARELHDVVAHHISVIGVMSEGAKRVLRADPDAAEEALTTVNHTARTALREMRDILAVLRQSQDEPDEAELEPQPTVESLRALVAQTKEAGLPVRYSVRGEEYPLPTGVSMAAYRIVQEALTNTIKHAGPKAKASVVVDYGETEFKVSVGDSGRGAPVVSGFSGGHGLIGMRERATLYGGTLQAGPQPGGGYLVEARFPRSAHLQGVAA
ncbi:sensor histidine kinase [Glycomyces xiaoerkulensis]|uniref:sensor histidine kinase n=1 Tax=Glycomyces xiaoerkulensis TaxID=2038139 RepID=UPI000C25AC82|nr:sensor histidine kinase [Glycomyces xiaoerkulensis]